MVSFISGEEHGCFTEQCVCRISYIWYKGKGQCACEKVAPKTMIKPADQAYFSTNAIRFCQLSMQFLGRIKWFVSENF
ncbi:hypothetical protein PVAP13_1NG036200 [Panicum virgatum]|uniref:Uncharacterized protein n=1 Tax=Panicum virgatum TaxID=38727 RepID=A0A8T0WFG9_PANVG|nr:hypothetical protein PVAP13_1NG036200 [Panicum virgatum]